MMHAYQELYLDDAKKNLSTMFDYAMNYCNIDADDFSKMFLDSNISKLFESGNPGIIAGKSGIELAMDILKELRIMSIFPEYMPPLEKTKEYWAGWVLAVYQWKTGRRFKDIFKRISLNEIINMYYVYHEMDITRFIEEINERFDNNIPMTNLKRIRWYRGITQKELAVLSGVSLRSIELYEQRVNDIDKAQVNYLYKISRVLGCCVEDLLEDPTK